MALTAAAIAALIAAGVIGTTATVGGGAKLWNSFGSDRKEKYLDAYKDIYADPDWTNGSISAEDRAAIEDYLNGMSDPQLDAMLRQYRVEDDSWRNLWGLGGKHRYYLDTEHLLNDLAELAEASKDVQPNKQDFLDAARAEASEMYSGMYDELDALMAEREASYQDELANLESNYRAARTGLLSQQQMQNAQLMDTLQSGMERSRRNALEAGASAGVRIADNINTLLSVQNKQSATSMETANQLSQMMINQRNAEADARRSYDAYKYQNLTDKQNRMIEEETYATNLANTNYGTALDNYNMTQDKYDRDPDNYIINRRDDFKNAYGKYGGN